MEYENGKQYSNRRDLWKVSNVKFKTRQKLTMHERLMKVIERQRAHIKM